METVVKKMNGWMIENELKGLKKNKENWMESEEIWVSIKVYFSIFLWVFDGKIMVSF